MYYPTESTILLASIGSVGVIASLVIIIYAFNRQQRFEVRLAKQRKQLVADAAARENLEVIDQ